MPTSQIIIEHFESQALVGNPLNDPTTRRVPVYLPPGYSEDAAHYPVVYMLAPFAGRGLKMLNDALWDENIQERMDRLIAAGRVQPIILVLPDSSTRFGGSQYLNSTATGNYEDHILELVEYIDGKYRTIADREHRAVAGRSSGGFAATLFGMRHPEVFGLVADHSGDKYFEMVYRHDFPSFLRYYDKAGEEGVRELLADPGLALRKGVSFHALNIAAMAACYSPNPDAPLGFDLPFDLKTGELRPAVWARWTAWDPVNLVAEHTEALRSLKLLFFDCGKYDEYSLLYGARIFAERLQAHDVLFHYEEFEGGHRNIQYRYDVSLCAISSAMGK